jgi:hypothetical protein
VTKRLSLSGVRPGELRAVYRQWQREGVDLSLTGGNHVKAVWPDGFTYIGPLTSGDRYVHRKVLTSAVRLRRAAR